MIRMRIKAERLITPLANTCTGGCGGWGGWTINRELSLAAKVWPARLPWTTSVGEPFSKYSRSCLLQLFPSIPPTARSTLPIHMNTWQSWGVSKAWKQLIQWLLEICFWLSSRSFLIEPPSASRRVTMSAAIGERSVLRSITALHYKLLSHLWRYGKPAGEFLGCMVDWHYSNRMQEMHVTVNDSNNY